MKRKCTCINHIIFLTILISLLPPSQKNPLAKKMYSFHIKIYHLCFPTKKLMCSDYFYWDFIHFPLFYSFSTFPFWVVSVKNFNPWSLETKSPYPSNCIFNIFLIIQLTNHISCKMKGKKIMLHQPSINEYSTLSGFRFHPNHTKRTKEKNPKQWIGV